MNVYILCLLLIKITQLSLVSSSVGGNQTDKLSLLAFKAQITSDPFGILNSWNDSTHFCTWSGVTCGRRHHRVTVLELESHQLRGALSPSIGNLSFLRILDLQNNSFTNGIPQELGRLLRLEALVLYNNSFTGEIPSNISHCSRLYYIGFTNNKLTGELPREFGFLSNLQGLYFSGNNLVGQIPPSLGNLSSLVEIYGLLNNFHGGLPDSFGKLKKLEALSLGGNNLSGIIPLSIYNLSSLTFLSLEVNNFEGSLPSYLGHTLPNLETFFIHTNRLTGQIPVTISNATKLWQVELAYNKFTGKVPTLEGLNNLQTFNLQENNLGTHQDDDLSFLSNLLNSTDLRALSIESNNFGGMLPNFLCNFSTKLEILSFGGNHIHGNIPSDIGNLISLSVLGIEINQLTGSIPSSVGKMPLLTDFSLSENKLSGGIPSSLGNLTFLEGVDLSSNGLMGRIPSSIGNWKKLLALDLSGNSFSGTIPREVMSISSLSKSLNLSNNQFNGSIPLEVGSLVNLGVLDVSNNRLSGEIPTTLSKCTSLESLYLGRNFISGIIPESMSSLKAIQRLDLSHNNLSGQIPDFLASFKLKTLNLSFNSFEGEVPRQGVFLNASAVSIGRNSKLCGGISELHLPICSNEGSKKKHIPTSVLVVLVSLGILVLTVVVVLCLIIFYCSRKTKEKTSLSSPSVVSFVKVSYDNLLKATDGFSPDRLIGRGGFGSVYKGILELDGKFVAVKVLNLQLRGAFKSFMAECEALRNIRHRNLVKIITICSSIDYQGNDFMALVYEFMANGSVESWLHPTVELNEAPRTLNLLQRVTIAIDVASALSYLHHHGETPIVHCDLKPSNILLDGQLTGRVSDFGLAKFLSGESQNTTSLIGVRGSMGYTAPEYGMGSEVSTSGDVYSFGILLLEIFTGKRPTDDIFKDGLNLRNYVEAGLTKQLEDILDPVVVNEIEKEDTIHRLSKSSSPNLQECLSWLLGIGVACSAELPRERMKIEDAENQLRGMRNKLSGNEWSWKDASLDES